MLHCSIECPEPWGRTMTDDIRDLAARAAEDCHRHFR